MWQDLSSIANFCLNTMTSIASLCTQGILIFVFGFMILRLVVRFFKRIL